MTTKNTKDFSWHLRPAKPEEVDDWDNLIINNPDGGNFIHSRAFASIKSQDGWTPYYFIYEKGSMAIAALGLTCSIFRQDDLWYFPKGPGVSQQELHAIIHETHRYVKTHNPNVFLVQMEPELREGITLEVGTNIDVSKGIQAHSSTVIVSLKPPIEVVFKSLSKRARYNIRLGERESIQIKRVAASEEHFRCMYALMKTVAGGRGVAGIRPYAYYRRFWQTYITSGKGMLYFAYEKDSPVIGAFVIRLGNKAFYKDGGSTPRRNSKGASYLLQWRITQDMKATGITSYDMLGTPPRNRRHDEAHWLHGVGLFKTAFNKDIIDYSGVFNVVFSGWKYALWKNYIYPTLRRVMRLRNRYFY
jgi:serine/alanine adding enzyme